MFLLVWRSEPHLRFSIQSRVFVSAWHSEPLHLRSAFRAVVHPRWAFRAISPVLVFRAIIPFQLGFQSHYLSSFRCLEPLSFSSLVFRAIVYLHFGVQSHYPFPTWSSEPLPIFVSVFRAVFCFYMAYRAVFSPWRLEPCFLFWHLESYFQFRRSEPSSSHFFCFGVQSHPHHIFSFGFQSRHYRILSFGVQSHHHFLDWRSESYSQFWRSEQSPFSVSAFRVIIITHPFWRSEPSSFLILAFRAIIVSQLRRLEPLFIFGLALRAITVSQLRHSKPSVFTVWPSKPLSSHF